MTSVHGSWGGHRGVPMTFAHGSCSGYKTVPRTWPPALAAFTSAEPPLTVYPLGGEWSVQRPAKHFQGEISWGIGGEEWWVQLLALIMTLPRPVGVLHRHRQKLSTVSFPWPVPFCLRVSWCGAVPQLHPVAPSAACVFQKGVDSSSQGRCLLPAGLLCPQGLGEHAMCAPPRPLGALPVTPPLGLRDVAVYQLLTSSALVKVCGFSTSNCSPPHPPVCCWHKHISVFNEQLFQRLWQTREWGGRQSPQPGRGSC